LIVFELVQPSFVKAGLIDYCDIIVTHQNAQTQFNSIILFCIPVTNKQEIPYKKINGVD